MSFLTIVQINMVFLAGPSLYMHPSKLWWWLFFQVKARAQLVCCTEKLIVRKSVRKKVSDSPSLNDV